MKLILDEREEEIWFARQQAGHEPIMILAHLITITSLEVLKE